MDLEQFVLAHEPAIRLSFFLGVFALVALWERLAPRRALVVVQGLALEPATWAWWCSTPCCCA